MTTKEINLTLQNAQAELKRLSFKEAYLNAQLAYYQTIMDAAEVNYSVERDARLRKDGAARIKSLTTPLMQSIERKKELLMRQKEVAEMVLSNAKNDLKIFAKSRKKKATKIG